MGFLFFFDAAAAAGAGLGKTVGRTVMLIVDVGLDGYSLCLKSHCQDQTCLTLLVLPLLLLLLLPLTLISDLLL